MITAERSGTQKQRLLDVVASLGYKPGELVIIRDLVEPMGRAESTLSEYITALRKDGLWPYEGLRNYMGNGGCNPRPESHTAKPEITSNCRRARRLRRKIERIESRLKSHASRIKKALAHDESFASTFLRIVKKTKTIPNSHQQSSHAFKAAWKQIEADVARSQPD